jgi:uncharacterized membrane protein YdfJ with MMPL/SSD domain
VVGFAEAITRRPMLVIAVWIVVALLAFPLFANLSSVVKEKMYTLPEWSESMKASKLMEKIMGTGQTSVGVIIVDGVNLRDNSTLLKLVRWGKLFNRSVVGHYASKVEAVPVILASVNETLYHAMLTALNASSTNALNLYNTLLSLDKAWNGTLTNITSTARRLNETAKALMQADEGYVKAFHGLYSLAMAVNKTYHGMIMLDKAYADTTKSAAQLLSRVNSTATGLAELDKAYSTLYRSLRTGASKLLVALANRTLVQSISHVIGFTWWQVSRTYDYMNLTGGNYTAYSKLTNLTMVNPQLKPLPRDEAVTVYRAVSSLVERGYSPDAAALNVTLKLLGSTLLPEAQQLAGIVARFWLPALEHAAHRLNATSVTSLYQPPPRHVESQLQVLKLATNISTEVAGTVTAKAEGVAAGILAAQLKAEGLPENVAAELAAAAVNGTLRPADAARAVVELAAARGQVPGNMTSMLASILAAYDPNGSGLLAENRSLALKAAAKIAVRMGAPEEAVEAAVELLEARIPLEDAAKRLAVKLLEEKLPGEAAQLLPLVVKLDPNASGILARNTTLTLEYAARLAQQEAARRGLNITYSIVEMLARMTAKGSLDNGTLRRLALEMVTQQAAKRAGSSAAKTVEGILARYDPNAEGTLVRNETLVPKALYEEAHRKGTPLTFEQFAELVRNPSSARRIAAEIFKKMAVEKAPEQAREVVAELAAIVVEKGPGIKPDEAWSIVENLMLQLAEKKPAASPSLSFSPPKWLTRETVHAAVRIARGEAALEAEALRLSERLLLETIAPKTLEDSVPLMVSRDYTAFVVMVSPLGSTGSERAKNVEETGRLAGRLLGELGIQAKVYVSGEDVLLQQVKSYAMKDAERASRLSELGTFIVLLVILESLFAVLLPYIGIVLGLAVGGAVVYIAASHGIIDFSSHTQSVMITTALGLGADYAGYLVHRFREEYALTGDAREAARRSLKRAGPAIVASALTVMIGFGSLLLAWDISFIRGFGEAIPIAVAATATATLTLVPALLAMVGDKSWFWWPRRPSRERLGRESKLMALLVRHEKIVVAGVLALIAFSAYFYATFKGTHDMKLMLPENAPALKAMDILSDKFEAGITDPIYIVVKLPESLWQSNQSIRLLEQLTEKLKGIDNVATVLTPLQPGGKPVPLSEARKMASHMVSSDGKMVIVQVILSVDPYTRKGVWTIEKVHRVVHEFAEEHGLEVYVGGSPYATLEMDHILKREFYDRVLPAAATLMIVTFTAIFGGFTVSVVALLVIIGAAMTGIMASVLLFQYLAGKQILWFLNIISLAAVMGVGMDYNSFFLARALEEYHKTGDSKEAVVRAAGAVSRFIIGLSLVVTTAYAALLTASNIGMREMGFTLATTVFVAGLMASYLLTPLTVSMLGRHAWWPWGLRRRIEH